MLQLILATTFIASMYELNRPFYPHDAYPSILDMFFTYNAIKDVDKVKLYNNKLKTNEFHAIPWKIKVSNNPGVTNDGEYIIISKKMMMPSFLPQILLRQKLLLYIKKLNIYDEKIVEEECNKQQL